VELPTYTGIWKIEKRLYKLYDFRLPMPIPVGQVAAFLAIAAPYMLILTLLGMPFSHTWVWVYVLPPGALAWLVTRPVLEAKRLPELVLSQVRYIFEPRTWCRLAPSAEKDQIIVVARVWRMPVRATTTGSISRSSRAAPEAHAEPADTARPAWPDRPAVRAQAQPRAGAPPGKPATAAAGPMTVSAADGVAPELRTDAGLSAPPAVPAPVELARVPPDASASEVAAAGTDGDGAGDAGDSVSMTVRSATATAATEDGGRAGAREAATTDELAAGVGDDAAAETERARSEQPIRPVLTVHGDGPAVGPLRTVERALRTSPGSWHDHVVVVPGGHRPGKPDHAQRDQARARLPLAGQARIVVLGTTAGAGQTVTTLLTGQLLATLRGEAVAVLDLGGQPGSLTELARQVPRLLPSRLAAGRQADGQVRPGRDRGLQVVTASHTGTGPRDADRLIETVVARYPITLADPAAADVPRAVQVADQLVLVAPAGAHSAGSLAMTLEWLEAHGRARLAQAAITVLNGVSSRTTRHAERAAAVAAGRCRAVVRVPYDRQLAAGGALALATVHAYTALAGLLISGLADSFPAELSGAGRGPAGSSPR
jgi:hypothetical protein